MINLLTSACIPECLLVTIVGYLSFRITEIPVNILTLVVLFFTVLATMLQNDWRDRSHDIHKGKLFASSKPNTFLIYVIISWIICFLLNLYLFTDNPIASGMLFSMAIVGLLYSEARHVPFLSVTLVTITVASSTLLPLGFGASIHNLYPFLFMVLCIMFGRETLHDINDVKVDTGYKKTIPIILGDTIARILSALSLVLGSLIAVLISPLSIVGVFFIVFGLSKIKKDIHVKEVRSKVDIGLAILAITFLVIL